MFIRKTQQWFLKTVLQIREIPAYNTFNINEEFVMCKKFKIEKKIVNSSVVLLNMTVELNNISHH